MLEAQLLEQALVVVQAQAQVLTPQQIQTPVRVIGHFDNKYQVPGLEHPLGKNQKRIPQSFKSAQQSFCY